MTSVSSRPLQKKLLELGVTALRIKDRFVAIWSSDAIAANLIQEVKQRYEDDYQMTVEPYRSSATVPHCQCGRLCDVLLASGTWQCSTCNPLANRRKLAVLELLEKLNRDCPSG